MHDVMYASVTALARAIRAKEISSAQVVQAYLQRIEAVNPPLNVVVQLCAETAQAEARAADTALARGQIMGPLHGVPMTITLTSGGLWYVHPALSRQSHHRPAPGRSYGR